MKLTDSVGKVSVYFSKNSDNYSIPDLVLTHAKMTEMLVETYYKYDDYDVSTVHHLYHKLFNLDRTLHTDTARDMAKPKMKFIKMFAREYMKEIQGV